MARLGPGSFSSGHTLAGDVNVDGSVTVINDISAVSASFTSVSTATLSSTSLVGSGSSYVTVGASGILTVKSANVYDIRDFGALDSPTDIGPAVQLAGNAALAAGGGTIFIPPRANGALWGWSTSVTHTINDDKTLNIEGVIGGTAIQVPNNQGGTLYDFGASRSTMSMRGLIFVGTNGDSTSAACIVHFRQARLATMEHCHFYGLRCNATNYGVVRIIADSVHVSDCHFMACEYTGTENGGGVLSITGERDACLVEACRFSINSTDSVFRGVTYTKWDSTHYGSAQLWFGGQGSQGDVTAFGGVYVNNCYFESPTSSHIVLYPEGSYIIRHAKIAGCSMNSGNSRPSIYSRKVQTLNVEHTNIGGSLSGSIGLKVDSCDDLLINRLRSSTSNKKVQFNDASIGYVELVESPDFTFDTQSGAYVPAHGVVQSNGTRTAVYPI